MKRNASMYSTLNATKSASAFFRPRTGFGSRAAISGIVSSAKITERNSSVRIELLDDQHVAGSEPEPARAAQPGGDRLIRHPDASRAGTAPDQVDPILVREIAQAS